MLAVWFGLICLMKSLGLCVQEYVVCVKFTEGCGSSEESKATFKPKTEDLFTIDPWRAWKHQTPPTSQPLTSDYRKRKERSAKREAKPVSPSQVTSPWWLRVV